MRYFKIILFILLSASVALNADAIHRGRGTAYGVIYYALPSNRVTTWMPGLSYAPTSGQYAPTKPPTAWTGGIPTNYTQSGSTLTANGSDQTSAINSAISTACGSATQSTPKKVLMAAGHFKTSSAITISCSYVALIGAGAGPGCYGAIVTATCITANSGSATIIENTTNTASQIISIGVSTGGPSTAVNQMYETSASTADMTAGSNCTTLASPSSVSGMSVSEVVYVNEIEDPNISWVNGTAGQGVNGAGYWGWGEANGADGYPSGGTFSTSRPVGQAMEVASFNSGTGVVCFTTPFAQTYRLSHTAHLGRINPSARVQWSGISNMFLAGPTGGSESLWGDGWAKLTIASCSYCWAANIEISGHGKQASALVDLQNSFRVEVRDSYLHGDSSDITNVEPGGSFYNIIGDDYTSDSLIENNISWIGNKVMVMRDVGSGNVVGYNYADDAFGYSYMSEDETGMNEGHMVGSHHTLFEGNYTHQCGSESRWGNTNFATWFRNQCSGMRVSAWPTQLVTSTSCAFGNPLIGANTNPGGGITYYEDAWNRNPVKASSYSYNYNYVGNVLGIESQPLLTSPQSTGNFNAGPQTAFSYEQYGPSVPASAPANTAVPMWTLGVPDGSEGNVTVTVSSTSGTTLTVGTYPGGDQTLIYPGLGLTTRASAGTYITGLSGTGIGGAGTYPINNSQTLGSGSFVIGYYGNGLNQVVLPTTLRDANYDYFTNAVHWHGIGGSGVGQTTPPGASTTGGSTLPNSLYMTSKPAFFHSQIWPWVDGSNATTPIPGTLPAQVRFQTCAPNTVQNLPAANDDYFGQHLKEAV